MRGDGVMSRVRRGELIRDEIRGEEVRIRGEERR